MSVTRVPVAVAVLVRPGADPAAALSALAAAGIEDALVVELEAPGAWAAARNAAIARAGDAEVLALVGDDVRVGAGWGMALEEAWVEDLGAAWGPVAPAAGLGARADHAEVLGIGAGPWGDLLALRLSALRGVGGFFPVRGHADARDGFDDAARALSELQAAGWRTESIAGLAAERDVSGVGPRELVRRRWRAGARAAALAPRSDDRVAGLKLAVRAGAAAVVARGVRGDREGAVVRVAWAAAGLGRVLGARLVHDELQPDRARTALRPSVPPPAPAPSPAPWRSSVGPWSLRASRNDARPAVGPGPTILLYHRVVALPDDPLGLAVQPERFAAQLAVLARDWEPVPLSDVLDGRAGPRAVAVTFDDGYHDNLEHARPALAAAGIPATLFASTGHVATGAAYWWDEVTRLLASEEPPPGTGTLELELPEGRRAWRPRTAEQRAAVRAAVHAALQTRDAETIAGALAALRTWAGEDADVVPLPPARDRPLTVAEVQELAVAGPFDVQAHGRTHVSLAWAPAGVRNEELRGSAHDLERWLGRRPTVFSYPFGVPGVDVDDTTRAAAQAAGYAAATVNAPGPLLPGGDRFALPRRAVPDLDGPAFARWLAGA